jgi:hypothetical protein
VETVTPRIEVMTWSFSNQLDGMPLVCVFCCDPEHEGKIWTRAGTFKHGIVPGPPSPFFFSNWTIAFYKLD